MMSVDAQHLFPGPLGAIYDTLRSRVLDMDPDIIEEFAKTKVSYGAARKFIWLSPLTKSKALLTVDMWDEHQDPMIRDVIRYREDKFTHQIEVRTAEDVEAVSKRGWFAEAARWGRKER
jgi:predicted transport protein